MKDKGYLSVPVLEVDGVNMDFKTASDWINNNQGGLIRYMNIPIKMNKDFERALSSIDAKYGEDFEILNGFNESQLNFSDFIDGFVDKNVADVTIDGNANAHHKDICSMLGEKGKSEDKLFAFNKIFYELYIK